MDTLSGRLNLVKMIGHETAVFTQALARELSREPRILAAYVHGSFGKESFRPNSDVDCAILMHPGQTMSSVELMRLSGALSGQLRATLDLGILSGDNLVYFVQAIGYGFRIFCRDEAMTDALVARAFSLYARLREERREVEAAYHVA